VFLEAKCLKTAVRHLLNHLQETEISAREVWELACEVSNWQEKFDPTEEFFPAVQLDILRFEDFESQYWADIQEDISYFGQMMERTYNMCLSFIASNRGEDANAIQILFAIHPNLVLEKFAMDMDESCDIYFEEEEMDLLHEVMVSRLETPEDKMLTINLLRDIMEQLKMTGLDIYPQFRMVEKMIQNTMVLETDPADRFISTEERPAPKLELVHTTE